MNTLRANYIDHINMTVKNLAGSIEFYRSLFGFEILKEQAEWKSVIIGNSRIKLCLYEDPGLVIGEGLNHFGFHVENFGDIRKKCIEMEVSMPYDTVNWEKSKSVYIVDPSGYEIELSQVEGGGL